jgi:aminopeptidase
MTDGDRSKYAELLFAACNPRPGQNLLLSGEPEHWPLLLAVAEVAYDSGIRYVDVQSAPGALTRVRALHSRESYLAYQPASRMRYWKSLVDEEWAVISVRGAEDPDALSTVDSGHLGIITEGDSRARKPFRDALRRDQLNWVVCAAPTVGWSKKVLGPGGTPEALWELLKPIIRLDKKDPVAAWREHQETLVRRAELLTDLQPVSLHFSGGGTDLTVPMNRNHSWMGGGATSAKGLRFSPNLPTEEVFTTPFSGRPEASDGSDAPGGADTPIGGVTGAEGRVVLSRPAQVLGQVVEDAVLTFEKGEVVSVSAKKRAETLETFIALDDGTRRMGEIALVDSSSPIYRSKTVFFDTLLDENAACHFALGFGYPDGVDGGLEADEEGLLRLGVNVSRHHLDFMFGHAELSVTATLADGRETPIMTEGRFVDAFR